MRQPPESAVADPAGSRRSGAFLFWLAVGISLIHLYFNLLGTLSDLRTSALHFGLCGLLVALMVPGAVRAQGRGRRAVLALDVMLGVAALGSALYLVAFEDALYERGLEFAGGDWLASMVAIVVALELVRRTTGWVITVLIAVALSYVAWWGVWLDGVFAFPTLSAEQVLFRSYFTEEGMFGTIARVSWSYVFMFILFGAFLVRSGAGAFIIDLARALTGRVVGGPGLVAVFGSGLMGSVSGSAVANTVSTGIITIPLMKRTGFPAKSAAAIEAAASTGGQLMPPVMGAGAFIMSNYTQISYLEIIAAAFLPAVLYFISLAMVVRVEARRAGVVAEDAGEVPKLGPVLRRGWHFLIPLGILVGLLVAGYTPTYAAGIGLLAVIVTSWFTSSPMLPGDVAAALADGARNAAATAVLLVAIGLVVGVVTTTGLGNTFSLMITQWAGGSLLVTVALVALASLVLGMGLPVTASYIVLATLSAPAIYALMAEAGLIEAVASGALPEAARALIAMVAPAAATGGPMPLADAAALVAALPVDLLPVLLDRSVDPARLSAALLSAHMIIFWLSQDSNVTPPVCLTAYAAAGIAGSPPMATGLAAWKIAKGLYVIPLLLAFTPLIGGGPLAQFEIFLFAVPGFYAMTGAFEGYLERPVGPAGRVALAGLAALLFWPGLAVLAKFLALAALAGMVVARPRAAKATPSA